MRLPPINSPNARHFRGEPRYLLYKKQTQSSLGATQTNSQAKTRGRTPSSPYPVICQVGLCSITFPSLLGLNSSHMTVNYVAEIDRNFNLNSECSANTYFYRLLRQIVLSLLSYHLWIQKIGNLGIISLFLCLTQFAMREPHYKSWSCSRS